MDRAMMEIALSRTLPIWRLRSHLKVIINILIVKGLVLEYCVSGSCLLYIEAGSTCTAIVFSEMVS